MDGAQPRKRAARYGIRLRRSKTQRLGMAAASGALALVGAAFWLGSGRSTLASVSSTTIQWDGNGTGFQAPCTGTDRTEYHFILPAQDNTQPTFVTITATFRDNTTFTYTGPYINGGTETPDDSTGFVRTMDTRLISASAQANGADEGDFFSLENARCIPVESPSPSPSESPSPSPSESPSPSPSILPTASATPSPSPSESPSASPSPSPTPSPSILPTASATPSPSPSESPSASPSPSPTPSPSILPTASATPSPSPTESPSPSPSASPSASPSESPSASPSESPSASPSPSPSESPSPSPSPSPSILPTASTSPSPSILPTSDTSATPSPTAPNSVLGHQHDDPGHRR